MASVGSGTLALSPHRLHIVGGIVDHNFPDVKQLGEHIIPSHADGQLQVAVCGHACRIVISNQPSLDVHAELASP
jgi:hypothetical protein